MHMHETGPAQALRCLVGRGGWGGKEEGWEMGREGEKYLELETKANGGKC